MYKTTILFKGMNMKILIAVYLLVLSVSSFASYVDIDTGENKSKVLDNALETADPILPYLIGEVSFATNGLDSSISCAADETNELKCWNSTPIDKTPGIKNIKNLKMVSVGGFHVCAIDSEGVKCSTPFANDVGQSKVPANIVNPRFITTGMEHTCVLDDEGVKCWGDNSAGQLNLPQFKNPTKVFAKSFYTCVLDENKVQCFGKGLFGSSVRSNIDLDQKPDQCEVTSKTVICSHFKYEGKDYSVSIARFKNAPQWISNYTSEYACALIKSEVRCWGRYLPNYPSAPTSHQLNQPLMMGPSIDKTFYVNKSDNISSILDKDGIKLFEFKEGKYHKLDAIIFDPSKYFYNEKAYALRALQEFINNREVNINEFSTLEYLRQVIVEKLLLGLNNETTPLLKDNSQYIRSFLVSKKLMKIENISLRDTAQLKFVLTAVATSITSSKQLLSVTNKHIVDQLNLGFSDILSEDEISIESAAEVINQVAHNESLMQELRSNFRLMGVASLIEWSQSYVSTGNVN
jgi:hypothetical protein